MPAEPSNSDVLRNRVQDIMTFIQGRLYYNRPDLEVKGAQYNAALLFGMLTGLSGGKELIVGEPGLGKTTSAEYISALLYRIPLGAIWGAEVSGHPEQTEEKIVGRPDLGRLNQGEEVVVWADFALLPTKIVDEINRLPETKQSMILDGVDRGNWRYLNQMTINSEYCLFATANYQDRGTNTIVAPLLDRFDVMVESKHPGPNISWMIGAEDSPQGLLRDPEREVKLRDCLRDGGWSEEAASVCDAFGEAVEDRLKVPTLRADDRTAIRSAAGELPFDEDASALMRCFLAELSFCCKYGQKRSNEQCDEGCHYTGYLCYQVQNCPSNRLPMSVRRYAQMLAWLLGDSCVGVEHLQAVLPYTCAHRLHWRDDEDDTARTGRRTDVAAIHRAREAVRAVTRRYREQSERIKEALAIGYRIYEGEKADPLEGEHPIYLQVMLDLGIEPGRRDFSNENAGL
jgi:hypothetical protein